MPLARLPSCFMLLLSALSVALSHSTQTSQLLKTHKRIDPGFWGTEFETSLSVHDWSIVSRAPGHVTHPVTFVLQARNMDTIKQIADEVSDPSSPRYGQHLDIDGIARIVQAPDSEIEAVTSWLELNKIEYKVSKTRHVVEADAPAAAIEALLNCELFLFKNKDEPERTLIRKVGPMYLPLRVADVVRAVFNVVDPPLSRKGRMPPVPPPSSDEQSRFSAKSRFALNEPTSAIGQLVSVRGTAFRTAQVNEPSPTTPFQIFAFLRCLDGSGMEADNCKTAAVNVTATPFVSMSIRLFISDPRNAFGAGSSWDYPQFITTSNIDSLCPPNPVYDDERLCNLEFNIPIPTSMSVQGYAIATFANASQQDVSSFVVLPSLLPSTPQLLSRLYNAPLQYTCLDNRTSYAIFSSTEVVDRDDIDAYGRWIGLEMGSMSFDNLPFEKCPACERGEATLDVELMLGMVKGATMWHWNFDKDGLFFYLTSALLNNLTGTPDVISVSYGSDEDAPRSTLLSIVNDMFAMLATTAKTIIVASGDNGVYGNGCKCSAIPVANASMCGKCCGRQFSFPEWPATSPYVIVVGGTAAVIAGSSPFYQNPSAAQNTNAQHYIHEIMAGAESGGGITSGGGYSSMFPAAPFMKKAIMGYLQQQSSNTNLSEAIIAQSSVMWPAFNASGTLMRGYPDVSALAARIPIFLSAGGGGKTFTAGGGGRMFTAGTSASTPLFASYIVMMNDLRLQAGLPKLGYMLPLLYMLGDKHPEVYNDVTVGYHGYSSVKNGGCNGICPDSDCIIGGQRQGLTAAPGWDAVTGFGSINFERMLRYVLPGSDAVSVASLMINRSTIASNAAAASSAANESFRSAAAAQAAAAAALNFSISAQKSVADAKAIAASVLVNATAAASAVATAAFEATASDSSNARKEADTSRIIAGFALFCFLTIMLAALALSFALLLSNIYLLLKIRKLAAPAESVKERLVSRLVNHGTDDDGARNL